MTRVALAARGGDRDLLARLVALTRNDVWRLCAYLVDRSAADDLTQETYLRLISGLARYRGEAPARTWVLAIARHTCLDHLRARIARRAVESGVPLELAGHPCVPDESGTHAVRQLLLGLDDDQRDALILTQIVGLSYDEAARVVAVPVGTIRSRVARARARLVAMLDAAEGLPQRPGRPTRPITASLRAMAF